MKQVLSTAKRGALAQAIALGLALSTAPAAWSQASGPAPRAGEPVTLNFANAEVEAVARTMATLTGRNLVVDPRVKGTLNLSTDRPVSPAAAFEQFTAALRLQGFALVESQGLYKIMPEAEAKLQSPTVVTANSVASGGQIVTQIFRLNHESANSLVAVLRPLISPNNTINVTPGSNALVITDYADNLRRIGRIISALDTATASDVEVIPLKHALANDLAPLVQKLIDGSMGIPGAAGQGLDSSFKTVLLPEPRSNALVLRAANPARVALVRALVDKLDRPNAVGTQGNIHVVYLKNADATQLATTLRAALAADSVAQGTAGSATTGGATMTAAARPVASANTGMTGASAPLSGPAQPSVGGQIQADPATNALIITAPEPQVRQLRAVIDQLDMRRAQVYVESLIAEVNADKAAEFGVQWQGVLGKNGSLGLIGTNSGTAGANILGVTAGLAAGGTSLGTAVNSLGGGLNLALAPSFNGRHYLGALANFLQSSGDGNVLSTPNLLTLDNEEAKIVIGQNVPFVTGQYTNNNSANGSVNPFQTIERKDVGLTLRVRPQVSENGTVKMTVFQEVSSISDTSTAGLITNKRSIESSVLVEDGSIVVLGGLLQDDYSGKQDKVPGLGDLPVFGNLFKSEARSRKKTNLMVFLRPVVLRDARQSESLALDRYELMRGSQAQQQPQPNSVLGISESAQLAPLDLSQPRQPLGTVVPNAANAPVTR
ncbi:type II secretion system secretin GspD [Malikia sp.]|uniref:type II secretion system secretin GspD n=1 Tax=Malikia sp. TaxID=2070706 RepID=UPI0026155C7F|nr:type II secretion system secretin GspD [Malikia sp.]MDD2729915.1 type II secretion system secretin GspD [Malikia sp.]